MPDEENFQRALEATGVFPFNLFKIKIIHPILAGCYLEIDNLAQKKTTLFIFEGKSKKEEAAIKQLLERYKSFTLFKKEYLNEGFVADFKDIRLFYYSFKRRILVEYDSKGRAIRRFKFDDFNMLMAILRNI